MSSDLVTEEALLTKWRNLTPDSKQQVIDFVDSLGGPAPELICKPPSALGEKLQRIRNQIVASGTPLLTEENIEQEVRDRRGGY